MSWLPGWSIFGSHTPIFWMNVLLGAVLGYVATRMRSAGTQFEGVGWVQVLGTVAGMVGGATVFLCIGIVTLLIFFVTGGMHTAELVVLSVLAQVALFAAFVFRREYP